MAKGRSASATPPEKSAAIPRHRWDFKEPELPSNSDGRQVRLLEYIAHYLEGIEIQLERIANSVESGSFNEPVRKAISDLEGMLMILNQMKS
jgi:hypothetical protein